MTCEYCGSNKHKKENCRITNLANYLVGNEYDKDNLPKILVVTNEENLIDIIEETHAIKHLRSSGKK
jgi:hypothetical protein